MSLSIAESLKEANKFLKTKGLEVFYISLYGSQNYGLETPESDIDLKAVVIPSVDDIIANKNPISTSFEFNDGLIDVKDIRVMFDNYKKQNPNYMETLFSPYVIYDGFYSASWNELNNLSERLAFADPIKALKAIYGMAQQKERALCHPYPSKIHLIEKYGYDSKQLSNLIRLFFIASQYLDRIMGYNNHAYESIITFGKNNDFWELSKQTIKSIKTYDIKFSASQAQVVAESYVSAIKTIVDKAIEEEFITIDKEAYNKLDEIKANVMRKSFSYELSKSC